MQHIITLNNINFKNIIAYPNISINAMQTTFVCGDSGTGKSTLLQLINNVISPESGEITFKGENITSIDPLELRKNVLLCNQSIYLFDETIEENFKRYYELRELPPLTTEQIRFYLELCCINFPLESECVSMSGGERHRIFIAICLSFLPAVLMLDEPTAALDDINANRLIKNIKSFSNANNITLIIVCHDKNIVDKYADNVIELKRN